MSDTESVTLTKRLAIGDAVHDAGATITVSKAEASELRREKYIEGSDEPGQAPAPEPGQPVTPPNGNPVPDEPDPNKVPPGEEDEHEEDEAAGGSRVRAKGGRR